MNVKRISLLLSLGLLLSLMGCGDDEPTNPGIDYKVTTRDRIVESGALPRWLTSANQSFLFTYQMGEGNEGIFLSDLDGNVRTVWDGPHNHDYTASPDGGYVAFSTSELDGGVYLFNVNADGLASLLIDGASDPAWLDASNLIFTSENDGLVRLNLETQQMNTLDSGGFAPHTPGDGSGIAYFRSGGSNGLRLYWLPFSSGVAGFPILISTTAALDVAFTPAGSILVSVIDSEEQSVVVRYALTSSPDPDILILGATDPSMSGDSQHLFANRISTNTPGNLYFSDMVSGSEEIIEDASFAAAEDASGGLLVQSEWGIERISFGN